MLYGFSKSTSSSDLGSGLSGVHQLKHNLNIGVAPGITCFVNDFTAVEASIASRRPELLIGMTRKKIRCMMVNVLPVRSNFKINLLSIDLGIVFIYKEVV